MKKIQLAFPAMALVVALTLSAFTSRPLTGKQWHFKTNQVLADARVAASYEDSFGSVSCGGSDLPCIIDVPHIPNNSDMQDLQAYLNGFGSDQEVVEAAFSQQN